VLRWGMKSKLNLEQLRLEIRDMTRTHALYRLLRDELTLLGFWRARPRGDPAKAYRVMKQGKENKR